MARKKLVRGLPAFSSILAFKSPEHKEARLLELLRGIAFANQSEQARVFYSMREVARHFKVPVSLVARVYGQLEQEGILAGVRGSKTLLQGRSSGRQLSVLGFVGMPALTSLFVTVQDYRTFFIRTRRELRARGFAVATIFVEPGEIKAGRLLTRIKKYSVDTMLWYDPDRAARETIAQLGDTALPIIGIRDRNFPAVRCRYEIQRETAIRRILHEWHSRAGINSVVVVRGPQGSAAKEELIRTLVEEEQLRCQIKSPDERGLRNFLDRLGRDRGAAIIF